MPLHTDDPSAPGNLTDEAYNAAWQDRMEQYPEPCGVPPDELARVLADLDAHPEKAIPPAPPQGADALAAAPLIYIAGGWISSYGTFSRPRPWGRVVHTLEAPIRAGIARSLCEQGGWLDNAGLGPHRLTDPSGTAQALPTSRIGGHVGARANSHTVGYEHAGQASMSTAAWLDKSVAQQTLDNGARIIAWDCAAEGWSRGEIRWLSGAQIRANYAGTATYRGLLTHNDVSQFIGGTTHWDPGPGFAFPWYLQRVLYWYDIYTGSGKPTVTPPIEEIAKYLGDDMPVMVKASDYAGVYMLSTGKFVHMKSQAELALAKRTGLMAYDGATQVFTRAQLGQLNEMFVTRANSAPPAPLPVTPALRKYTVQAGDTLTKIAAKYPPLTWQEIASANKITNPESIVPGQVLTIPDPKASTPETPTDQLPEG